jgi:hypothetical protein
MISVMRKKMSPVTALEWKNISNINQGMLMPLATATSAWHTRLYTIAAK